MNQQTVIQTTEISTFDHPAKGGWLFAVEPDQQTARSLAQLTKANGFRFRMFSSVTAVQAELARKPAVVLMYCDDNPRAALTMVEQIDCSADTTVILSSAEEHSEEMRRCFARTGVLLLSRPLDLNYVGEILGEMHSETTAATAEKCMHTNSPPLDQCGYLRGSAPTMRKLYRLIRKVSNTSASVLIVGESGTGKELVAETLHMLSGSAAGPFLAVNCGAIPQELIESELFGHEKGSFSGAERIHHGVFERARGGTLFLDEISEMPAGAQVKLLRALESGHFRRVGGEKELYSDARIIAASNRSLTTAFRDGALRRDLYYRLAQFTLQVPPLRDRGADILGLSELFLQQLNQQHGTEIQLPIKTVDAFLNYSWPGNVRELKSAIERTYVTGDPAINDVQAIDSKLCSPELHADSERILTTPVGVSLEELEKRFILVTLKAHGGNKKRTAAILGISLKTLYNRLQRYNFDEPVPLPASAHAD